MAKEAQNMRRYDVCIIGAGPAGLSAAIEARKFGLKAAVFDENHRPGGQLFKQIHKFFGSKEHKAKIRGFEIGRELLEEAEKSGVDVHLDAVVMGIYEPGRITVREGDCITSYSADSIIVATGASENTIPFEGWTLPGVIGAGAAQTMMNLHGVLPGKKILMMGSGNVGLVVGFQLLQAGCEVAALIDAADRIGGYGVHAAKLARCGIPFYLSHTIVKAEGNGKVEKVTIAQVDKNWHFIHGTEKTFDVDTVCLAVGLTPMSQLLRMTGCKTKFAGGTVPVCDKFGETSINGLFASGDVAGIEEASSAMIGGRISAVGAAYRCGFIDEKERDSKFEEYSSSLQKLRKGLFSKENKGRTDITKTDEGIDLSVTLLKSGYMKEDELSKFVGTGSIKGPHPVIECTQNIPCNPCEDSCAFGCIHVGEEISAVPKFDDNKKCRNCKMCVAACPGQAIFIVDDDCGDGYAAVSFPYEFFPLPQIGEKGQALGRDGKAVCEAEIIDVAVNKAFDHTAVVTMKVPKQMSMTARFYRKEVSVK